MTNINTANIAVNTIEDFESVCGLCADSGEAVNFTFRNGDSMVLMKREDFEKLESDAFFEQLNRKLRHSSEQVKNGEVVDGFKALDKLAEEFGL